MALPLTSHRIAILNALMARVAVIRASGDDQFATDAGQALFLGGVPALGPADPDAAIAILPLTDVVLRTGENALIEWPIQIAAVAKADAQEPWVTIELVLADIKRAIELPDRTLSRLLAGRLERGPTEVLEREPGSTSLACAITYVAQYAEGWGTP